MKSFHSLVDDEEIGGSDAQVEEGLDAAAVLEADHSVAGAQSGPLNRSGDLPDLISGGDGGRKMNPRYGGLEYEELHSACLDEVVDPEWKYRAQVELQEKEEWRQRDIQALRDLVLSEEGFYCDTSDQFLIKFLRAKKFDYESSFRMLQRYLALRARSPANFEKCLPSKINGLFEHQLQHILPHRDQFARRVFIFCSGKWDPSLITPQEIFTANYMCLELMAREPKTQIAGMVALVDMAGFGWYHMMQMTLDYIKDMVAMVQNSFPIRFREIHIVNESYFFDMVFQLVKPFLTDKIRARIRFHGADLQSLHRSIPKRILPTEYGGEQPSLNNAALKDALDKMEDYFLALQTYGYRDNIIPEEVYDRESHPYPSFCLSGTLPDE